MSDLYNGPAAATVIPRGNFDRFVLFNDHRVIYVIL